jgi:hypothetical protein
MEKTVRKIDVNRKIYTFSDIHGDLQLLINILLNCNVIRKKNDCKYYDQGRIDPDLDIFNPYSMMHYKIMKDDIINIDGKFKGLPYLPGYKFDLNYEWCGGDSIVVIVGDIIDMARDSKKATDKTKKLFYECEQLELKIIMFINKMNEDGEKIIKMVGNHEHGNFFQDTNRNKNNDYLDVSDYITPYQSNDKNMYFNDLPRIEFFKKDNIGYKLFIQGGVYSFLIINDTIFVHGQLTATTLDEHKRFNELYNNEGKEEPDNMHLWLRCFGSVELSSDRITKIKKLTDNAQVHKNEASNYEDSNSEKNYPKFSSLNSNDFCNNVTEWTHKQYGNNIKNIIIGHCIQNDNFSDLIKGNPSILLGNLNNCMRSYAFEFTRMNGNESGITVECNDHQVKIFKVDGGNALCNHLYNDILEHTQNNMVGFSNMKAGYLPHALLIYPDNMPIVVQSSLLSKLINHQTICKFSDNYYFIKKIIIEEIKNRKWLNRGIVKINNNVEYSYFMQYNEDKIVEKIINDILLEKYNERFCPNEYTEFVYYIHFPPSPLFVSVDCTNRTELVKKYITKENMKHIFTCTLTDTKYMNKCISFDKMYNYQTDIDWLLKEIMFNLIELLNNIKIDRSKYIIVKLVDAILEYKKEYTTIKIIGTNMKYKDQYIDINYCDEQIEIISNIGSQILEIIKSEENPEANPDAYKQQLLQLFSS